MKIKHLLIINHKEEVYFKDILCWNYNESMGQNE